MFKPKFKKTNFNEEQGKHGLCFVRAMVVLGDFSFEEVLGFLRGNSQKRKHGFTIRDCVKAFNHFYGTAYDVGKYFEENGYYSHGDIPYITLKKKMTEKHYKKAIFFTKNHAIPVVNGVHHDFISQFRKKIVFIVEVN